MTTETPEFEKAESSVEHLIGIYEEVEERADGFMAEQDADMKLTSLRAMKRDIQTMTDDE